MIKVDKIPLPLFEDYAAGDPSDPKASSVQNWMHDTASAQAESPNDRGWCTLDLEGLTEKDFNTYFDRTAIGTEYETEYNKNKAGGKPFAFLQLESDLIYSMHKCFAARHRGRLMTYRDDCSQKKYHTFSSISRGLARYNTLKNSAEQAVTEASTPVLV